MRTIATIAQKPELAEFMRDSLKIFFGHVARINAYSIAEIESGENRVEEEIVVISAYVIFKQIQTRIRPDAILQPFSQVLSKDNVARLRREKLSGRVLMVNVDYFNCMQVITQLHEAGVQDIDFVPYYGEEADRDPDIRTAVTVNELQMIPPGIRKVVNLGERQIDIDCVIRLAEILEAKDPFASEEAKSVRDSVAVESVGMKDILRHAENADKTMHALIEYMDNGVAIVDLTGVIDIANSKAEKLLEIESIPKGFSIYEIIPEIDLRRNHDNGKELVFNKNDKKLIIGNRSMYYDGQKYGSVITIKNYEEEEENQYAVRSRVYGQGHVARKTFSDIKGSSGVIRDCIEKARRMAVSNASVLITGPSGSGKEVFAQSIHNASDRSRFSFVALNCAAIPENLLESELFGYEKGAFTGANKEGKAGYFELAHKGTIFLDEIGEMPLALQAKLLRVIEERSFARIGSSRLIDVDIRIIAATNQDLEKLVRKKKFRQDLMFRLNVLPLAIPPVCEREDDALELLEYFRETNGWQFDLDDSVRGIMRKYSWPGNIREIRNLAEYLGNLGKETIVSDDLPERMRKSDYRNGTLYYEDTGMLEDERIRLLRRSDNMGFILQEGRNLLVYREVLRILSEGSTDRRLGRVQIAEALQRSGNLYSQTEVRECLRKLSESAYIKSRRGPGGSFILPKGKELLGDIEVILG